MKKTMLAAMFVMAAAVVAPRAQQPAAPTGEIVLRPTSHPRIPSDPSALWMVPSGRVSRTPAVAEFLAAVKLEVDGNFTRALSTLSQPGFLRDTPLRDYVQYYKGLAELRTGKTAEAKSTFQALAATMPTGYLAEAVALSEAECDETLHDYPAALAVYERLAAAKTTAPEDILIRLGRAAETTGDFAKALQALSRVYYESPLSDSAAVAGAELDRLPNREPIAAGTMRFRQELARAERLFSAKRYPQARAAFDSVRGAAQGDDRELVDLRIAESDYFLKRTRNARDELRGYIDHSSRQGEALFFYALAVQDLDERDEYLLAIQRIVDQFPSDSWAEEALNNLATRHIVDDDDAAADETFREMYARFPTGRYAERAAWKIGWQAFRGGTYADTIRFFEAAAAAFPRSDYRPAWLYWSGRAHEALGHGDLARARYSLAATDYLNSYYGRLAMQRLNGRGPERQLIADAQSSAQASPATDGDADQDAPSAAPLPPSEKLIRRLVGLGLYDQAIDELHYAQKAWGDSPAIEATLAWIFQKQGAMETGERQFALFRAAINTMKRAYPQYLAAGGETLPPALLKVIYPIGYWDLIRKYSAARDLDPYLVAALMAQESTFVPNIQSYARAVGLMQLEPSTARRYARRLNMRYSSRLLTNPDANIRIGTAVLADALRELGDIHLVLASYNAGDTPVRRWAAERPGVPRDEFIDDIPYPQTQNYVKKILGTADDYRRLYGPEAAKTEADVAEPEAPVSPPSATTTEKTSKKKPAQVRKKHV